MKSIVVLFLVFFAHQAYSGPVAVESINDEVHDALEALRKVVNTQINATVDVINGLVDDFQKSSDALIENAEKQIDNVLSPILKDIEEKEKEARDKGLDISGCTQLKDTLTSIPKDTLELNRMCIKNITERVQAYVAVKFEVIRNMTSIIDDLEHQADECSILNPLCLTRLLKTIAIYSVSLPKDIIKMETETVEFLADAEKIKMGCIAENMGNALKQITSTSKDLLDCLLNAPSMSTTTDSSGGSTSDSGDGGSSTTDSGNDGSSTTDSGNDGSSTTDSGNDGSSTTESGNDGSSTTDSGNGGSSTTDSGDEDSKVKKAIDNLKDKVEKQISDSIKVIDDLQDEIKQTADDLLEKAKNSINDALGQIKDDIEKKENKAKEKGLDTSGCQSLKDELEDIPKETLERNLKCIQDLIDQTKAHSDVIKEEMRNETSIVDDLYKQLEECSGKSPLCLTKLMKTITDYTISIPKKIVDLQLNCMTYCRNVLEVAPKCVASNVEGGIKKMKDLSEKIVECIQNAPLGSSSTTTAAST